MTSYEHNIPADSRKVGIYAIPSGRLLKEIKFNDEINFVMFSIDGSRLYVAEGITPENGYVYIPDAKTYSTIKEVDVLGSMEAMVISPRDTYLATTSKHSAYPFPFMIVRGNLKLY